MNKKQKLRITFVTYLAYCIDKELYKAIDYLWERFAKFDLELHPDKTRVIVFSRGAAQEYPRP